MYIPNRDIQTMVSIGHSNDDINTRWSKMNWYTVEKSHNMIYTRGWRGHVQRQAIRHRMWKVVQNNYPEFRMYKIPYSIRGNSPCRLTLKYKIINYFKKILSFKIFR